MKPSLLLFSFFATEFANGATSSVATCNPKLRWEFFAPPGKLFVTVSTSTFTQLFFPVSPVELLPPHVFNHLHALLCLIYIFCIAKWNFSSLIFVSACVIVTHVSYLSPLHLASGFGLFFSNHLVLLQEKQRGAMETWVQNIDFSLLFSVGLLPLSASHLASWIRAI